MTKIKRPPVTLNKSGLAEILRQRSGDSFTAKEAVDAVAQAVVATILDGNGVLVTGLGTFIPRVTAARNFHDPQTRRVIAVPERQGVRFIPGASLLEMLRGDREVPESGSLLKRPRKSKK